MPETRPRVFITDTVGQAALDMLEGFVDLTLWDDPAVGNWPAEADILVNRTNPVSAAQIGAATRLVAIVKHGIGVDHVALDAAAARGIPVVNTPGTNAQSVAELTCMLAIAAARNATQAERAMQEPEGPGDAYRWRGREIAGRRVGIVGLGNVGQKSAPIYRHGFGCDVSAYDPYITDAPFETLGVQRKERFEALLNGCELLLLHVPLTEETRHMVNAEALDRLAPDAIVVNTARGGVVDDAALLDALESGRIAGAGCDVFETEPPPRDYPLIGHPKCVTTPHIGAATLESAERTGIATAEAVLAILRGEAILDHAGTSWELPARI